MERTVKVSYQKGAAIDTGKLILYFQSRRKSGGGPVEDLIEEDGSYLVVFEDKQGEYRTRGTKDYCVFNNDAINIQRRKHEINGIGLTISGYGSHDLHYAVSSVVTPPSTPLQDPFPTKDKSLSLKSSEDPDSNVAPLNERKLQLQAFEGVKCYPPTPAIKMDSHGYMVPFESFDLLYIDVSRGRQRYMQKYQSETIKNITKKCFLSFEHSEGKLELRGHGEEFQGSVDKIKALLWNISEETFTLTQPRVVSFLRSEVGQQRLKAIEDKFRCTIDVDEGLYASIQDQENHIELIHGTMASQAADVLVNTVGQDLDLLAGSTSYSLLKAGGDILQKQCKHAYPNGIQHGDIAKTTGGRLNCKEVYHCSLPKWENEETIKFLEDALYKCLYEATQSGYRSIILPPFGTEYLGYPASMVSRAMFQKIEEFFTYDTPLERVAIVLYPLNKQLVKCFEMDKKAVNRMLSTDTDNSQLRQKNVQVTRDAIQIGEMSVHIKQGDITKEDSECIVNSTNSSLVLTKGDISKAISEACGKDLELQCNLKVAEMQKKGIVVTTAPRLPSNFIMHVSFQHFNRNWKEMIKSCLKKAQDCSMSSIAFPSLGTGRGSLPMEKMTKILITSLREFGMKNSTIKDIRVVIFEKKKYDIFLAKLAEIIEKTEKETGISKLLSRKSKIKKLPKEADVVDTNVVDEFPVILCKVQSNDGDAEVTIYSEDTEHKEHIFQQIQDICRQYIITKSLINQKIKRLTKEQLGTLKDFLKDMNLNIVVHPRTGAVEVEGPRDTVLEMESLLDDMVSSIASY